VDNIDKEIEGIANKMIRGKNQQNPRTLWGG